MRLCLVSSILALIVSIHMYSGINSVILVFLAGIFCVLILARYHTISNGRWVNLLILFSALLSVGYSQYWLEDQMASRLPVALSGIKVSGVAKIIDCDYSNPQVEKLRLKLISLNSTEPPLGNLKHIVVNHYLLNRNQSRSANSGHEPELRKRLGCNKIINFSAKLRAPYSFINPYGFDYEAWQLSRGVDASGYLISYEVRSVDESFSAWLIDLRQRGIVRAAALPGKAGQIIPALLFGESGYLDKEAWLDLQITGTVHLLIVSGLHVSFLILLVMLIWRQLIRLEMLFFTPSHSYFMRFTPVALLFICLLYSYMAGMGLAVQRSGLMLMVAIIVSFSRYHWSLLDSWLWVMWMVLVINPMVSLFVGFWFSFFAVGGLLLGHAGILRTSISSSFSSALSEKVRVLYKPQWIIFLALLPLLWLFQQPSSFFSFFVNILAIPLLAFVILPLSLISFAIADGNVLVLFNSLLDTLLVSLHELSLLSSWLVFKPSGLWVFVLVPLTGFALLFKGFPFKLLSLVLVVFVFLLPVRTEDDTLLIFDVGQGLAVYGRLGSSGEYSGDVSWLYDTGAKFRSGFSLGDAVVGKNILALSGDQLDLLFISHSDNDHAGGEAGLLRKVRVKTTYAGQPNQQHHSNCHNLDNEWHVKNGLKWRVFNLTGLDMNRLSDNNLSCVIQIEMAGQRILIPGDAERKIERALIDQFGEALKSDILLVGHHGSKTSSGESFIRAVSPKLAIVSSGLNNPFGHPHQSVIDRFKRFSIPVYNTATSGAIEIKLDEKPTVIEWRNEKPPIWRQL
jgi:competence protein ComEC